MAFEAFEIGHPCDLPDGKYHKGQVHAIGSKYAELQQFLPRHKPHVRAVLVEGGLVVGVEWADPGLPVVAPAAVASKPEPAQEAAAVSAGKPKKPIFFGKK